MASKRWSVAVTDLTGTARLHEITVEADNWMSALRAGRTRIGEEGGVPQGASCAVSPDGVVSILDSVSRRKFVLTQRAVAAEAPQQHSAPPAPIAAPSQAPSPAPSETTSQDPSTGKRKKFQTVAFDASMALPVQPQAEPVREKQKFQTVAFDTSSLVKNQSSAPVAIATPAVRSVQPAAAPTSPAPTAPTAPAAPAAGNAGATGPAPNTVASQPTDTDPSGKRKKFQTVAFDASTLGLQQPRSTPATAHAPSAAPASAPVPVVVSAPVAVVHAVAAAPAVAVIRSTPPVATRERTAVPASMPATAPTLSIQLLHQRSEDPTPKNPLTYRERSFVITGNITPAGAEQMLRAELGKLKEELSQAKRGKFINLALFDHSWQARPQRPPVAALQWKDWKGDPEMTFPAAAVQTAPATTTAQDDRLATAFEALQDLPFLTNAAEGLDFAVKLLGDTIPSQAVAACLYDINTDELRVVAAAGTGSQERKAQAIPVAAGVFGQAARAGDRALVIADALSHPEFDPGLDSAPGIQARNMLLRPLMQEGQLFGVLQLINRVGANGYSAEDVSLINYISERVADFVRQVRLRGR